MLIDWVVDSVGSADIEAVVDSLDDSVRVFEMLTDRDDELLDVTLKLDDAEAKFDSDMEYSSDCDSVVVLLGVSLVDSELLALILSDFEEDIAELKERETDFDSLNG